MKSIDRLELHFQSLAPIIQLLKYGICVTGHELAGDHQGVRLAP